LDGHIRNNPTTNLAGNPHQQDMPGACTCSGLHNRLGLLYHMPAASHAVAEAKTGHTAMLSQTPGCRNHRLSMPKARKPRHPCTEFLSHSANQMDHIASLGLNMPIIRLTSYG